MSLPGITKTQMVEIDRIMMEEYHIPVELMIEHAGSNLARLALILSPDDSNYQVIVGSGNNGGGGVVAARRLKNWGLNAEIFIPRGFELLRTTPKKQLDRAQRLGVEIFEGLPQLSSRRDENQMILDCYIGYGFKQRVDKISDKVFSLLSHMNNIISLDAPSGLDVTTGENISNIHPIATLTIAFVKTGFFNVSQEALGELYIVDIGVPSDIYRFRIGIDWSLPYQMESLEKLQESFRKSPLQKVVIQQKSERENPSWDIVADFS